MCREVVNNNNFKYNLQVLHLTQAHSLTHSFSPILFFPPSTIALHVAHTPHPGRETDLVQLVSKVGRHMHL